jgi:hypothetical protein
MASLRSRKTVLAGTVVGVLLAAVSLWWLLPRPGVDDPSGSPPSPRQAGPGRRPSSPAAARRAAAADARSETEPVAAGDPAGDSEVLALWSTVQDTTLDTIVRESAALKLASRGDRAILDRLWALWRQGRLPAGCSWIRDLMAAATQSPDVPPDTPVVTGEERPEVPAAEVARAAGRAANQALPLEVRLDAVRALAAAQSDEALAVLKDLCTGAIQASAALQTAAFEALLQADDQLAVAALKQLLAQSTAPAAEDLATMLQALADEPHPGAREIALPLLRHAAADVREEAAWLLALNSDETTPADTQTILEVLGTEDEAAVRRRLYSALDASASPYASSILTAIVAEEAASVRLSGYQALAGMAAAESSSQTVGPLFDAQVVGELAQMALNAPEYQYRFEAVVVLKTAHTAGANAALARIAAGASDSRIAQAAAMP